MAGDELESPSFKDVIDCQAALFEWAESFDSKDWERLAKCLAPTLYIDYRHAMGTGDDSSNLFPSMPANKFIAMASSPKFLGNPRIFTQHFIGGAIKWTLNGDGGITASIQMRVAHQKYKDDELTEVLYKGHAHGTAFTRFSNVDGVWKFAGLRPEVRWTEGRYDMIFRSE